MAGCPVCGNALQDDAKICGFCGFHLKGGTESFSVKEVCRTLRTSDGDSRLGFPALRITEGPMKGVVFHLDSLPVHIGRDPMCDLFLNNRTVSRQHAVIDHIDGRLIIHDVGSMNGIWLNGSVVDTAVLHDGDLLQIGTFPMEFIDG